MKYCMVVFLCLFITGCERFSAGSYPYAEQYEFEIDDTSLINELTNIKRLDSSLRIPLDWNLIDGYEDKRPDNHWYHMYFYDKTRDKIIHTWVRENMESNAVLALVSIKENSTNGKWKEINKDFTQSQNSVEKKEFAKLILQKIKYPLNQK